MSWDRSTGAWFSLAHVSMYTTETRVLSVRKYYTAGNRFQRTK